MPEYREMYLKMMRASEEAVNIIIKAQRECEELYISAPKPKIELIQSEKKNESTDGE